MRAVVFDEYGPPSVLKLEDATSPVPSDNEVLVRIRAASVNPGDWDVMRGVPYILRPTVGFSRPRNRVLGLAIAGTAVAVSEGTSGFQPGDDVYAETRWGGFAEYAAVPAGVLAPMPSSISFEEAAAVPVAATTALQGLRDTAEVKAGQQVLINGASGGVGTFAVQIAKAFDAEVTGVCSTANVDLVRSIGADHVVDYTQEDFTKGDNRYDLIFDNVGNRTLSDLRGALASDGMMIPNSNKGGGTWVGSYVRRAAQCIVTSPFTKQKLKPFAATDKREDLVAISELIEAGSVRPIVDRTYPLEEAAEALAHYGEGHTRGKVVITMDTASDNEPGD